MRTPLSVLVVLVLALPLIGAEEKAASPGPKEAWQAMQKELNEARTARNGAKFREIQAKRPAEFLAAWEKSEKKAAGEDSFYLGQFLGMAKRHTDAMGAFRAFLATEGVEPALGIQARLGFARAVNLALGDGSLEGKAADAAIEEAEGMAEALKGKDRASLHQALAGSHDQRGRSDVAIEHYLRAARLNPAGAYSLSRTVLSKVMGSAHKLSEYDAARELGRKLVAEFVSIQEDYVKGLREEGGDARTLKRAESYVDRIRKLIQPLEMLGKPAPVWTVEHAFGDKKEIADFAGKVVMIDFWATWCGWCIRSFPAIRDLLRDYRETDFALIGVTASASYVIPSNYNLDEDMKKKIGEGYKVSPLRLARDATEEQAKEFREKEKSIIAEFIGNHEMTWPVVMIDKAEPAEKYALTGWPHAIVLDRKGRVRYFKRGALLRDRPEAVKKFRAVIDGLLAEKE